MSNNQRNTLIVLIALTITMTILAFASVPLYRMFCQKTGFAGTPKIGIEAPTKVHPRKIRILFNADINPELPWRFRPLQRELTVRVGETALAFFEAENLSLTESIVGWATYNVTPDKAGPYFVKMHCFCFTEQTLEPGQKMEMPVSFFIDPGLIEDKSLSDVTTITLSYTFFRFKGKPLF